MTVNSTVRTILFWLLMILLAVVLWKMASTGGQSSREKDINYTDFLAEVQQGKVSEVTVYLSPISAEVQGDYRDSGANPSKFRVTVPQSTLSDLTKQLEDNKVRINIKEVNH